LASDPSRRLGIIINGATGGLVSAQHLPALLALRQEGGLPLPDGSHVIPDLLLVGRDAGRLERVAQAAGLDRWTTDLDAALSSREHALFFDAAATAQRHERVLRAIAAGKHVYCEKPIAETTDEAMALVRAAAEAGLCHGVVQDKIFLPGFSRLKQLREQGFFGRILEVRLEFSRWVSDGERRPAQRPSWNYRKRDGGGLILDMFPHWRYLIEQIVGTIRAVSATGRTHVPQRRDEQGNRYAVDVEDAVFAQMELDGGIIASVNSSWASRIRRDNAIVIQIDGTEASAVAGTHDCYVQTDADTPAKFFPLTKPQPQSFFDQWRLLPEDAHHPNSYRIGWELFIRHMLAGAPFPSPFIEGAKGVQLVELSHRSDRERRWIAVPELGPPV
jgi:predicted dehydrogenase